MGANVNSNCGLSLISSIESGNYEITKLLVDRNIEINSNHGIALATAFEYNQNEIIELLIKEGATVDSKYKNLLVTSCVKNDNAHSFALLIKYDIINTFTDQIIHVADNEVVLLFSICFALRKNEMLEFIIDNCPEITPRALDHSFIEQKDIKKYNFIKMLINRNLLDIVD